MTDGPDEPSLHPPCAHQHSARETSARETSARQTSVKVSSDRGLAIVAPQVQVDAGNVQLSWEALVPVSQDHSIIVADLTAWPACD